MNKKIDAVLTHRSPGDGFYQEEVQQLLECLCLDDEEEVDAILLEANEAVIFGFIRFSVSDEKLDFDTGPNSASAQEVIAVANDQELETDDGLYDFAGVKTLMRY